MKGMKFFSVQMDEQENFFSKNFLIFNLSPHLITLFAIQEYFLYG